MALEAAGRIFARESGVRASLPNHPGIVRACARTRHVATALLLALSLLGLPGCAHYWTGLEPLEVFLVDLEPIESEDLEQRFIVELRLLNPNQEPLSIEGVDLRLDVNGRRLARGLSNEVLDVPALGDAIVRVTVTTSLLDVLRQIFYATTTETFRYDLGGRVFLRERWGHVAISGSGEWEVSPGPEASTEPDRGSPGR